MKDMFVKMEIFISTFSDMKEEQKHNIESTWEMKSLLARMCFWNLTSSSWGHYDEGILDNPSGSVDPFGMPSWGSGIPQETLTYESCTGRAY